MRKLVQWLRLIRLPLVFTAIGDAWAVRMLHGPAGWALPPAGQLALLAGLSFGLYSLGMALNDLMDVRIDQAIDPSKPIPSGDVRPWQAALCVAALIGLIVALSWSATDNTFIIAGVVGFLIVGYNIGLKRLPIIGLLLLGAIRGLHCQLAGLPINPAAGLGPVLAGWVSVFLFSHVAVASWISHEWEGKRPPVGPVGRWVLAFLIVGVGVLVVTFLDLSRWTDPELSLTRPISPRLVPPLLVAMAYLVALFWVLGNRRLARPFDKGRMAMRLGLIWLLVYDAAFLASAGRWAGAVAMGVLLALLLASARLSAWLTRRCGLAGPIGRRPPGESGHRI